MALCGFLSPDGEFTECESFFHLVTASDIVEKIYKKKLNGIRSEEFLYEQGYVVFYDKNAAHRFRSKLNNSILHLTDKQKDFIIFNMYNASNEQKNDMEKILKFDADYKEDSILSYMEDKYINQ